MNGYERIKAALEGKEQDKVPVMLHNFQMAAYEAGLSMEEFRSDPKKLAQSFIKAIEKYKYDGILVDVDTATLAGACGVHINFPKDKPAQIRKGILENIEDIRKLKKIDILNYKYVRVWLESVRILKDYFKDDIFIRGNCDQAPFSLASMLRGAQEFMMDLYDEDNIELVFNLLEYCYDITSQFIELMAETGAHSVSNGDSVAGPSMISPGMYAKFAFPYEKKIVDKVHSLGTLYTLHICGNTNVILDKMVETRADSLELDYLTDINKAHDLMKDKTTFVGNIDPSGVLALGNVNDVIKATKNLLDVFSDTPRFILCSGCAIPPSAPSENIKALIETARNYR